MTDISAANSPIRRLGIFGGTFDPVHLGHLQMAEFLRQQLQLQMMNMMPCGNPAHRSAPYATPSQRLQMLKLALAEYPHLGIDDREVKSTAASYSVSSLEAIRQQYGSSCQLYFCMGADSLASFCSWHRWQDILDLCAVAVVSRDSESFRCPAPLTDKIVLMSEDQVPPKYRLGQILFYKQTELAISSTQIRGQLASMSDSQEPTEVPSAVLKFIKEQRIYN